MSEVSVPEDVLRRDGERRHEVLRERPDGGALRVGERSIRRADDLDPEGIPVHVGSAVPRGFSGVPEDVVRRSDLVRGSVDVDDEVAGQDGGELTDDPRYASGRSSGMVEYDEFLGINSARFLRRGESALEREHGSVGLEFLVDVFLDAFQTYGNRLVYALVALDDVHDRLFEGLLNRRELLLVLRFPCRNVFHEEPGENPDEQGVRGSVLQD